MQSVYLPNFSTKWKYEYTKDFYARQQDVQRLELSLCQKEVEEVRSSIRGVVDECV